MKKYKITGHTGGSVTEEGTAVHAKGEQIGGTFSNSVFWQITRDYCETKYIHFFQYSLTFDHGKTNASPTFPNPKNELRKSTLCEKCLSRAQANLWCFAMKPIFGLMATSTSKITIFGLKSYQKPFKNSHGKQPFDATCGLDELYFFKDEAETVKDVRYRAMINDFFIPDIGIGSPGSPQYLIPSKQRYFTARETIDLLRLRFGE